MRVKSQEMCWEAVNMAAVLKPIVRKCEIIPIAEYRVGKSKAEESSKEEHSSSFS
jgi:hypothetical protein